MTQLYNLEAEQSVLGAMLLDFGAWESVQPLKAEHFYDHRHGVIYNAISEVVSDDKRPDAVVVGNALGDDLEDCGGLVYLQALQDSIASAKGAQNHANIVKEKAKNRQLLAACEDIRGIVAQDIPIDEKIDSASRLFDDMGKANVRKLPRHIFDIALERTQYYEDVENGKIIPGWTTYIPALDRALTGGLKPAKLVILAARPGVGKSSFSWQIAVSMASQGKTTLFLSMEMPDTEIADRAVSNMSRVNYQSLLTGKLNHEDWSRASEALEEMRRKPLHVDDQPALSLADIKIKARSVPGLKVLIVDYLQLCTGRGDNRNSQIEEISRGLKALAKDLDICIIALSQLNRKVEEIKDKRPNLSHLKDSGAIEQDADVVMFLWQVREFADGRKLIGLGVDKNRQGKQCEIALDFDGSIQRWGESMEPLHQSEPVRQYSKGLRE